MRDDGLTDLSGSQVDDYTLDDYVGRGNIGVVYRAHNRQLPDREVAVKLVTPPREGWDVELRKVAKLANISGVVHFHAEGTCWLSLDGKQKLFQYTVWDFIAPGRDLRRYLKDHSRCPASFLVAVIEQILRVLHACQHRGFSRHGDLHAGNILVGERDDADLDEMLRPRERIFVSDFGYGTTDGNKQPKDDYRGLSEIGDEMLRHVDWDAATARDRLVIKDLQGLLAKVLTEGAVSERRPPIEILQAIRDIQKKAAAQSPVGGLHIGSIAADPSAPSEEAMTVGKFQVSEMLGDDWRWWNHLFVASIPARSRILEADISTVVTGPRGCGKTMLFRRLSERVIVACGAPKEIRDVGAFCGFYVNANDIAAAFPRFPNTPSLTDERNLICYANLSILSDVLAVHSARAAAYDDEVPEPLLSFLGVLLQDAPGATPLVVGEQPLEHYRARLESLKWQFAVSAAPSAFAAFNDLGHHTWIHRFLTGVRGYTTWLRDRKVFLFIDDYTTPRISPPMQRVLNRLLFQRSSEFSSKIATESATTFFAEDSSGKALQDGDDFQLIDMGEETLAMDEGERRAFLDEVFRRRLSKDPRVPEPARTLEGVLGVLGISKTSFARRLRERRVPKQLAGDGSPQPAAKRRGASSARALYHGADVFESLWSGDTRTMIQLVQDLIDETSASPGRPSAVFPISDEVQDRVFRTRGGLWLEAQARNQPTSPSAVEHEVKELARIHGKYAFVGGSYGAHLKSIVEAFVVLARQLLLGPMYLIQENGGDREVPRMAFRIEILDEFRIDGLASEIYRDLIRYGLFMRDARGKSVRGAMVPRLYLRRFLLPFCTLALSKRDSVALRCDQFRSLLLFPNVFSRQVERNRSQSRHRDSRQGELPLAAKSGKQARYRQRDGSGRPKKRK